jgi:hypothetical protein
MQSAYQVLIALKKILIVEFQGREPVTWGERFAASGLQDDRPTQRASPNVDIKMQTARPAGQRHMIGCSFCAPAVRHANGTSREGAL